MTAESGDVLLRCARYETRLEAVAAHANRAVCVLVGHDGPIRLRAGRETIEADALLVKPGVRHSVDFGAQRSSVIYFDHALWPDEAAKPARPLTLAERDCVLQCGPDAQEAADECALALGLIPVDLVGVQAILHDIAADPMARMSQDVLARRLGCERSNALRKFKARTGLTFRGYKQWRAIRAATYALLEGQAIGLAALDAGFADAAHFSRSFRSVFGVSPSAAREANAAF